MSTTQGPIDRSLYKVVFLWIKLYTSYILLEKLTLDDLGNALSSQD